MPRGRCERVEVGTGRGAGSPGARVSHGGVRLLAAERGRKRRRAPGLPASRQDHAEPFVEVLGVARAHAAPVGRPPIIGVVADVSAARDARPTAGPRRRAGPSRDRRGTGSATCPRRSRARSPRCRRARRGSRPCSRLGGSEARSCSRGPPTPSKRRRCCPTRTRSSCRLDRRTPTRLRWGCVPGPAPDHDVVSEVGLPCRSEHLGVRRIGVVCRFAALHLRERVAGSQRVPPGDSGDWVSSIGGRPGSSPPSRACRTRSRAPCPTGRSPSTA